jgi:hypothetical protein
MDQYRVEKEQRLGRPTRTGKNPYVFKYKIVRKDGSLVFRTETMKFAQEILFNLPSPS